MWVKQSRNLYQKERKKWRKGTECMDKKRERYEEKIKNKCMD